MKTYEQCVKCGSIVDHVHTIESGDNRDIIGSFCPKCGGEWI